LVLREQGFIIATAGAACREEQMRARGTFVLIKVKLLCT
jgi:hypothetical protein